MPKPILMPQVGQDIETARIVEWYVKEGDTVKTGDLVAAVESDKATFELESFEEGTVLQILYHAGDEAKVLEPIAFIGEEGDKREQKTVETMQKVASLQRSRSKPQSELRWHESKQFISPAARRAAKIHRIDTETVTGSGPNGRIIKRDILNCITTSPQPDYDAERVVPASKTKEQEVLFSRMQKRIAERMVYSKQNIPHFYLSCSVDMGECLAWRTSYNETKDRKISINDLVLAATAMSLKQFPKLNAHVQDNRLQLLECINIGIAVSTDEGLLVPVLENADSKSLEQISLQSLQIIDKARGGRIKAVALPSFTISNLGMYGISQFLPIINPPECAILGVGMIEKKLVPLENDSIKICSIMNLSLVCDHRAVDGTYAAQFLAELKRILEEVLFINKENKMDDKWISG